MTTPAGFMKWVIEQIEAIREDEAFHRDLGDQLGIEFMSPPEVPLPTSFEFEFYPAIRNAIVAELVPAIDEALQNLVRRSDLTVGAIAAALTSGANVTVHQINPVLSVPSTRRTITRDETGLATGFVDEPVTP